MVCGTVQESPKFSRYNGLSRVTAVITDDSGRLSLAWYNQPWMAQQLPVGEPIMLYGRITVKNRHRTMLNAQVVREPSIQPVYKTPKIIPAKTFRSMIEKALEQVDDCCP